ncbi:MAG: hypothetical protein ACQESE_01120 [Nanobdellota archaeon]
MHVTKTIFLLSLILLVLTLPLSSAELDFDDITFVETNKSRPVIKASYNLQDAPITIKDYSLVNNHGEKVPITYSHNDDRNKFNFSLDTQGSLFGKYVLQIVASDQDDNLNVDFFGIDVKPTPMKIWVKEPKNDDIEIPEQQHIAVNDHIPFNLTLQSETSALCRIVKNTGFLEQKTTDQLYNLGKRFNDGNNTFTKTHKISVLTQNQESSQTHLNVGSFDYDDYEEENHYLVICKEFKIGAQEPDYKRQLFYIGYDLTDPEFTVNMTPQVIFDESSLETEALIDSNDDSLICSYDFIKNTQPQYKPESRRLSFNTNSIEDYSPNITSTFDFSDKGTYEYETDYPYTINFTCTNPAMRISSELASFKIRLKLSFDILYEDSGYYSTSSPELHFRTRKAASCRYQFDSEDYENTDGDEHNHTVKLSNLEEDEYSIKLRCTSLGGEVKEDVFDFTIDTTAPSTPVALSSDDNCNNRWTISLAEPSETVYYNISLYNSTKATEGNLLHQTLTSFTKGMFMFEAPDTIDVLPNATYIWKITAIDRAGLTSSELSHSTIGRRPDAIVCDTDYPTATLQKKPVGENSFNITISCSDKHSGCTDMYGYSELSPGQNCSVASYQNNNYNDTLTIPSETLLCYQVRDEAGHTTNKSEFLSTDIGIELVSPSSGIAFEKPFQLAISTKREAICHHGPVRDDHPRALDEWYVSLENFTSQNSLDHYDSIAATDYEELDETEDEIETDWIVICQEEELTYHQKQFSLGYDLSPPKITITATPNPITSASKQTTTLEVTVDDQAICTFLDREGVPRGFSGYDPDDIDNYKQSFSTVIDYWGFTETITQSVKCRNLAQKYSQETYDINIESDNDLGINITTPDYTNNNRVELVATTTDDATCSYQTSRAGPQREFQITGGTEHTKYITLEEGSNTVGVYCEDAQGGSESIVFKDVTVDTIPPVVEILSAENTCSLEQISGMILTNGTGSAIETYTYSINNGSATIVSGESEIGSFTEQFALTRAKTYTITAEATDKAGNTATISTTVRATPYSQTECDVTPPEGNAKISYNWNYNEVTVSCKDEESGCTDFYTYYLSQDSCQQPYDLEYYEQAPLEVTDSGVFCYEVYDNAANSYTDSVPITVEKQCFNGIEDPDEDGVDCGGPCPAQCGTCDNGKQDPFELGVDCGGICESIRTCTGEDDDEDEGCSSDDDCPYGQICNYEGLCVDEPKNGSDKDKPSEPIDEGPEKLGLILLIIGIFLFLGGGGYITYSRYNKHQQIQQQQSVVQQQMQQRQQQELARKRQEQRRKTMERLHERKQKQEEARQQRVNERQQKRKSLLGAFEGEKGQEEQQDSEEKSEEEQKEQEEVKKKVFEKQKDETSLREKKERQEQEKQQVAREEYQNIMNLKSGTKKERSVFDELESVTTSSVSAENLQEKYDLSEPQSDSTDNSASEQNALDELGSITENQESSSSPQNDTDTGGSQPSDSSDALDELEELVNTRQDRSSKNQLLEELSNIAPENRVHKLVEQIETQASKSILDTTELAQSIKQLISNELVSSEQAKQTIITLVKNHTLTEEQGEELINTIN